MDWDKWKENYAEWGRSIHTQLCKAFTILSVCSSIANRLLFWKKKIQINKEEFCCRKQTHNLCFKSLHFWAKSLSLCLSSSSCGRFVVSLFFLTFALFWFRYTTSPHLFSGDAEVAFARVRSKVCPTFISFREREIIISLGIEKNVFFSTGEWWISVMSQETPDHTISQIILLWIMTIYMQLHSMPFSLVKLLLSL